MGLREKLGRLNGAGLNPRAAQGASHEAPLIALRSDPVENAVQAEPREAPLIERRSNPVEGAVQAEPVEAPLIALRSDGVENAVQAEPVEALLPGLRQAPRARAVHQGGAQVVLIPDPPESALDAAPLPVRQLEHAAKLQTLRRALTQLEARQTAKAKSTPAPLPAGGSRCVLDQSPHGPLCRASTRFDAGHFHGAVRADGALAVKQDVLALLAMDPQAAECLPARMLFLDTETTGLAGGTGTLPFLIGTAWFEEGALHVEQCVLRQPGEERPMLELLRERLANASLVVSFNGKSFDWPLLRTRFVMNRLPVPELPPHLDLLHSSRRVLRRRLTSIRLVEVEAGALGHHRVDDVDGSLIPELYFRFLRHKRLAALEPVLEHNVHDLVALAALVGWLSRGLEGEDRDARDVLGLSELARRGRDFDRALKLASAAAQAKQGVLASEALEHVAWLSRRAGNARNAADALRRALERSERSSALLHLELAKLYEHRLRDVGLALKHATQAKAAESPEEHRRRITRLERKSAARGRQLSVL